MMKKCSPDIGAKAIHLSETHIKRLPETEKTPWIQSCVAVVH